MDSSHVSLCVLQLSHDGFELYQCTKATSLGINLMALWKILKCIGMDDSLTVSTDHNEGGDKLSITSNAKGDLFFIWFCFFLCFDFFYFFYFFYFFTCYTFFTFLYLSYLFVFIFCHCCSFLVRF